MRKPILVVKSRIRVGLDFPPDVSPLTLGPDGQPVYISYAICALMSFLSDAVRDPQSRQYKQLLDGLTTRIEYRDADDDEPPFHWSHTCSMN